MLLRRPLLEEPISKLAAWSLRLGLFAAVVAALSILIVRSGLLEIVPALSTFAAALIFAALAVLLGFASFVPIWRQGLRGIGRATGGTLLGIALLAYPSYLGYRASKLPAIDDITTDTANPPRFEALAPLRPPDRIAYSGANTAALQHAAYADITPLEEDASPTDAYLAALEVVTKRRWRIVNARPPTSARREGSIEAVATTLIMAFHDDVVVRITPSGGGSRIDVRSASRVGLHDLGANATRVRALLSDIDDELSNTEEAPPEPQPPPQQKKSGPVVKRPPPPPKQKPAPKR